MLKAFKYRLYPAPTQQVLLAKHFGCSRFIYNWGLQQKITLYKTQQKSISCVSLANQLPQLKQQHQWLKEVNSQSLQMALRNLDRAFTNFFKKQTDFPKFKKKRNNQTFQCPQKVKVDFDHNLLHLLKIPNIRCIFHRRFEGVIKTTTISQSTSGKYWVSILVETADQPKSKTQVKEETTVGIDLGLKHFAILSTGEKIDNPKFLKHSLDKLKKAQRRLSHRTRVGKKLGFKFSKRRDKARKKVAKLHEKVANQRDDFLHKLTHKLAHDNQVSTYVLETLSVENMVKNHKLAQAIQDASWSKFVTFLMYKSEWLGKNVVQIGRFEPSSKMCSNCGLANKELTLDIREWKCQECGTEHDRDLNAAKNIRDFGLKKFVGLDESEVTLGESATLVATLN